MIGEHVYKGTKFRVYKKDPMGWLADIDGVVPGGRRTEGDAIAMAKQFIDHGTLCPLVQAHPFAKSAGGKRKLVPTILEILPKKFTRYFEPFVGGGALFFGIQAAYPGMLSHAWLNDANEPLISTYFAIQRTVEQLIKDLKHPRYANTQEAFLKVRSTCFRHFEGERYGTLHSRHAAEFIYLNRCGFNGLFRVNGSGQFNVPFGRYENPTICDAENLRACAEALKETILTSHDFAHPELIGSNLRKNDVIYYDPPYVPKSATADFTKYTADGFGPEDQKRLHDVALKLKKRGVFVLLSNSDTPPVRELYRKKDWTLKEVRMARAINNDGAGRGKVGELLIY